MPSAEVAEALEHLGLGARVERGGRLVEDEQVGVAHVGAGDGDLLPLAAREVDAAVEALAERLVVAVRQACDDVVGEAALGRALRCAAVVDVLDAADADILAAP